MEASDVMDMAFREAFHAALEIVGVAAGCGSPLKDAYRAAFSRNNPKHSLVLLRTALGRADQTTVQLQHFKAHVLGLLAEIEAAIPPDPEPAP
jgi:hypothetical protein